MGQTGLGGQENEIKSLSLSKTCCGKRRNTQTSRIHLQTLSDPGTAGLKRKAGAAQAGRGPLHLLYKSSVFLDTSSTRQTSSYMVRPVTFHSLCCLLTAEPAPSPRAQRGADDSGLLGLTIRLPASSSFTDSPWLHRWFFILHSFTKQGEKKKGTKEHNLHSWWNYFYSTFESAVEQIHLWRALSRMRSLLLGETK